MAEYMDKNPYPYGDKETTLEWNLSDSTESGIPRDEIEGNENVSDAITKEFDNSWISARAYPGKFMEHKWAHVSIWDRTGELTLKTGHFYRLFRCHLTLLKSEKKTLAMFIDCNIDKVTKNSSSTKDMKETEEYIPESERAKMTFINCRMPFIDDCKYYCMNFEGKTYLDEFSNSEECELNFKMTKKWICSKTIHNLYKIKKCKILVKSARWISGNDHTSNFRMIDDCVISIFNTDMAAR